ncbi:MAG: galactokinase [Candidatus Alcyoniella australis]|nr:galactokinase [Candidatus Alcyoniella australis]
MRQRFDQAMSGRPEALGWGPGRVNLIGGHVDYNQGLVLPIAIDKGIATALRRRNDKAFNVFSVDLDQRVELAALPTQRIGSFADYLIGVLHELHALGLPQSGWDVLTWGDMPVGGGLSSSAALELSVAMAACAASGFEVDRKQLALACQRAENGFVGMHCGILDQFASAFGLADHALLIDCRSLEHRNVALPQDAFEVAVIDSGVSRKLADSRFNQRRRECEQAARALGVDSLRDASLQMLQNAGIEPLLERRARHIICEIERVRLAVRALEHGDVTHCGELISASHSSLRDDYQVSMEQLDALCQLADGLSGVFGSRLVGGGFGGCTIHLTQRGIFDTLRQRVVEPYSRRFDLKARLMQFTAANGAFSEHCF